MPRILTGDHPLSGNIGINAPAYTIVKWQPLDALIDNDPIQRACAEFTEDCQELVVSTKVVATHFWEERSEKQSSLLAAFWIASRSLLSGAHSRDSWAPSSLQY